MRKIGKKHYNDIVLILALLIVALSVFIIWRVSREDGAYAVVTVDGEEIGRYSLSEDGEYSLLDGKNTLVISDGEAYMSHADCPDKVCVHTGRVSLSGERIVCLPNRLEVRIVSAEDGLI